jgi:hypothetical protein
MTVHSALYRGTLAHARRDAHARRAFRDPVYLASLDLAELPDLDRTLRLFSHGGRNLFALHDADYADGARGLPAALAAILAGNGLPAPATTRLITNLRVAGYVFNPVSFFLNYDAAGALETVIAEVNNTYGGTFRYVLGPGQRLPPDPRHPRRIGFRHPREFFVSPFLHGPAAYDFFFDAPLDGAALEIAMHVHQGERGDGPAIFWARVDGDRAPLTDRTLAAAALRYPLMTAQVIGLIYYEAIKMHLAGVPFRRPGPGHRPHPAV